jgi:hypothetical protein
MKPVMQFPNLLITSSRLGHFRVFFKPTHTHTHYRTDEQFKRLFNLLRTKRASFI